MRRSAEQPIRSQLSPHTEGQLSQAPRGGGVGGVSGHRKEERGRRSGAEDDGCSARTEAYEQRDIDRAGSAAVSLLST